MLERVTINGSVLDTQGELSSCFDFLDPWSPHFEMERGRADIAVLGERRLTLSNLENRCALDSSTPVYVGFDPLSRVYENENDQMVAYAFSHACLGVC